MSLRSAEGLLIPTNRADETMTDFDQSADGAHPRPAAPHPADPGAEWTLTCDPTAEELYHYIDGYLTEPRRSELRTHIETCPGCEDVYHFQLGLRTMLGSCREELPPEVKQRLLESISKLF